MPVLGYRANEYFIGMTFMRGCSYFRGIPIVLKICINKQHTMSQILKSSVAKTKNKKQKGWVIYS